MKLKQKILALAIGLASSAAFAQAVPTDPLGGLTQVTDSLLGTVLSPTAPLLNITSPVLGAPVLGAPVVGAPLLTNPNIGISPQLPIAAPILSSSPIGQTTSGDANNGSVTGTGNAGVNTGSGSLNSGTIGGGGFVTPRIPVSTALAPSLVSGQDTCLGSVSGAAQGTMFGLSLGGTVRDRHCEMLKATKLLVALGLEGAALARICLDEDMRTALAASGTDCAALPKNAERIRINEAAVPLAVEPGTAIYRGAQGGAPGRAGADQQAIKIDVKVGGDKEETKKVKSWPNGKPTYKCVKDCDKKPVVTEQPVSGSSKSNVNISVDSNKR